MTLLLPGRPQAHDHESGGEPARARWPPTAAGASRCGDHGRVTVDRLRREAEARGVATSYRDWHGRRAEVGEETLRAVLAAMGDTPPRPALGSTRGAGGGRGTGGSRDAGGLRGTGGGRGALAYQPPGEQVGHHRATPPPSGRCW